MKKIIYINSCQNIWNIINVSHIHVNKFYEKYEKIKI